MTPAEVAAGLIAEFDAAGVVLGVVDGRLRAWPTTAITDEVRAIIGPYRGALLATVAERDASAAAAAPVPAPRDVNPGRDSVPAAAAQAESHEAAHCDACQHRTRFGNCARPIEAALSERFELIGHPADGASCAAFEPAASAVPDAVRDAIDRIARLDGWSAADVAHALDVAARCPDAADWLALAGLVEFGKVGSEVQPVETASGTDADCLPARDRHEVLR